MDNAKRGTLAIDAAAFNFLRDYPAVYWTKGVSHYQMFYMLIYRQFWISFLADNFESDVGTDLDFGDFEVKS